MLELNLIVAVLAGLVSFLSPCVIPIVPGFLSYLSGASLNDTGLSSRKKIFLNSVFFVLGFSIVFAVLGLLLNTLLSSVAYSATVWLSRIGGLIVILFGLFLMGLIRIKFLEQEHKISVKRKFHSRYVTSFVFGAAFAAGWSPCVGAVLGAILALAASNPGQSFSLLVAYSIGLGLPFLLVGAFASQASNWINKHAKYFKVINKIFGALLVVIGILVFTQLLAAVLPVDLITLPVKGM